MPEHAGLSELIECIKQELQSPDVNIAKVSIALGAVELPLTKKDPAQHTWPPNLLVSVTLGRHIRVGSWLFDTANQHHHLKCWPWLCSAMTMATG